MEPLQQLSSNSPTVIEEEPAHEFYARICGKPIKSISSQPLHASSVNMDDNPQALSSVPIIPNENDEEEKKSGEEGISEFSKACKYNSTNPIQYSSLSLNQTNCRKGFSLLEKMGWKEQDGGLGKRRQGSLCPIATKRNLNQRGLGSEKRPLVGKITHLPPSSSKKQKGDQQQGPKLSKAERKRIKRKKEERQKRSDIQVKQMLRTDLSEEYESLYWTHCS